MGSQFLVDLSITNMKFLIVVGCLSVCASAAPFYGLVAHPNGAVVPADEPAVAAARAEHLSAKGVVAHAAYAAPAVAAPVAHAAYAAAPVAPAAYAAVPAVAHGYTGPLNLNTQLVGHPNGAVVPVDEPAVAAARAEHLSAKGAIAHAAYAAPAVAAAPVAHAAYAAVPAVPAVAPAHYGLVVHPNGAVVPADEPAVVEARAAHLNALAHAGH